MNSYKDFILFTPTEFESWLPAQKVTRKILLIQNHHTYLPDYKNWNKRPDAFYWMTSMENFHKQRGFSQIAQQLTTLPDGTICYARPFDIPPAGIKGANSNGICIEHFGNFDKDGDVMTEAHKNTIVVLNALLAHKFNLCIDRHSIVYHHWYNLTTGEKWVNDTQQRVPAAKEVKSCPGTNFFGGNMPADAEQNFYPLIEAELW
jgi:hypothetical protein